MTQTDTNPRDWSKLKRLAEAAIEADKTHSGLFEPGVWHVVEYGDEQSPGICVHSGDAWRVCFMATIQNQKDFDQQMAKAQHIATFNPATVLELIAENERLREANKNIEFIAEINRDQRTAMVNERDALKSQRDEMAEALDAAVEMTDKIVGQLSKAQSDWEQNNDHAAFDELCDWTYDGLIASYHSQFSEALRRARSSLNKTEKTDAD